MTNKTSLFMAISLSVLANVAFAAEGFPSPVGGADLNPSSSIGRVLVFDLRDLAPLPVLAPVARRANRAPAAVLATPPRAGARQIGLLPITPMLPRSADGVIVGIPEDFDAEAALNSRSASSTSVSDDDLFQPIPAMRHLEGAGAGKPSAQLKRERARRESSSVSGTDRQTRSSSKRQKSEEE
jgi:hypothetical protein